MIFNFPPHLKKAVRKTHMNSRAIWSKSSSARDAGSAIRVGPSTASTSSTRPSNAQCPSECAYYSLPHPPSAHWDTSCVPTAPLPMPMIRSSTASSAPVTFNIHCHQTGHNHRPPPGRLLHPYHHPLCPASSFPQPTPPASPSSAMQPTATTQPSALAPGNLSPSFPPVTPMPGTPGRPRPIVASSPPPTGSTWPSAILPPPPTSPNLCLTLTAFSFEPCLASPGSISSEPIPAVPL